MGLESNGTDRKIFPISCRNAENQVLRCTTFQYVGLAVAQLGATELHGSKDSRIKRQ
jgi:hypothetical protein